MLYCVILCHIMLYCSQTDTVNLGQLPEMFINHFAVAATPTHIWHQQYLAPNITTEIQHNLWESWIFIMVFTIFLGAGHHIKFEIYDQQLASEAGKVAKMM